MSTSDNKQAIIAVLGPTGGGKSNFINIASGSNKMKVGTSLRSCTTEVASSDTFLVDGHSIILLDTPGFNNTQQKDLHEILSDITEHMKLNFNDSQLSGIIYIHGIDERKVLDSTMRDIREFRSICGGEPKRSFVVATTMWQNVAPDVGDSRERELRTDESFLKPFHDAGVEFIRHPDKKNERDSAHDIIRHLLEESNGAASTERKEFTKPKSPSRVNGSKENTPRTVLQLLLHLFGIGR
ncbi:hypothetical protein CPB86DRAFT_498406 [Serendipita vermifera]|nr:hypothetical protein CPB86DRAFT_498406 [Serendipita vermifera]